MLAVAEMYIKGISTRDAEAVMKETGIEPGQRPGQPGNKAVG